MNALIYGLNYYPEPTGCGKYTGEMACWMARQGHDMEAICGLPHYPQWELDTTYSDGRGRVEVVEGVRVERAAHHIPSADALGAKARIKLETSFTLSAARYWLPRLFRRRKPDVVIAITPPMQIGVWPLLYGWVRRVPWILHVQDLQVDAAIRLNMLNGGVFGRFLYWVEGFLLRHATRVSTITEAMRQRIIEKGVPPERVWLCPNWADVQSVRPGPRDNDFRRSLDIADDTLVVLYAGNMGEKQGLDIVLEAAKRCVGDKRLLFLMVGDGGAKARLQRQAQNMDLANVRFLPLQPLEKLSDMLAAGDIHLVVQKREAADLVMPSKLTNIVASGRACVATADAGTALHEVVDGHQTGCVIPPDDAQALTDAVCKLADDADLRAACGRNARLYAEEYLDKIRILSAFEGQLQTLCK